MKMYIVFIEYNYYIIYIYNLYIIESDNCNRPIISSIDIDIDDHESDIIVDNNIINDINKKRKDKNMLLSSPTLGIYIFSTTI